MRSARTRRAKRRRQLFKRQKGKCFWCPTQMVLVEGEHLKHQPANLATIDHLHDRFHPLRGTDNHRGLQRWVLACHECNQRRGKEMYAKHVPIEEQRQRSKRTPDPVVPHHMNAPAVAELQRMHDEALT